MNNPVERSSMDKIEIHISYTVKDNTVRELVRNGETLVLGKGRQASLDDSEITSYYLMPEDMWWDADENSPHGIWRRELPGWAGVSYIKEVTGRETFAVVSAEQDKNDKTVAKVNFYEKSST